MARYFCQLCNRTVNYGENHSCLIYKNNDNVYTLPRLEELDKIDKKKDYSKDIIKENLNYVAENLHPEVRINDSENSAVINASLNENMDDIFVVPDSRRKRKFKSTSNSAQMRNPHGTSIVVAPVNNENASVNVSSENFEYTESTYEQNNGDSKVSHLSLLKAYEKWGMSLQDSKRQSFNNDKDLFMDSLECVIKSNHSVKKNITGSKNSLLNSDFLQGNKKPKHSTAKISRGLKSEHILSEITSEDSNNSDEMAANEEESICSMQDDIADAGPSGIRPLKKKFVCDICSKHFEWKCKLETHYRIHIAKKKFACKICKKLFSMKSYLSQHYKIHFDEKTFVCDICGKGFNYKTNLQAHYRIHTGEKPFVCYLCENSFARKDSLKKHIRAHTGEKPYQCPACEKSFTQISNCITHRRRMHE